MAAVHRVLKEMYIGMGICMIAFLALGAFFMRSYYVFAIALLVGNVGGVLRIYHMYDILDQALDMEQEGAKRKTIIHSLLRTAISVALMVGSMFISGTAFVGVTIGLIEPKISAYFNPQIRKLLIRLGLETEEELTEVDVNNKN